MKIKVCHTAVSFREFAHKIPYYYEHVLSVGSISLQKKSFKYHLDQPCCQKRAMQNHPSHTSQRQHSGSFLYRKQQTTPSSERGCSRVSSPSQASLWEVILGDIYDSPSWDGGGPKMDHEENTTSELNADSNHFH